MAAYSCSIDAIASWISLKIVTQVLFLTSFISDIIFLLLGSVVCFAYLDPSLSYNGFSSKFFWSSIVDLCKWKTRMVNVSSCVSCPYVRVFPQRNPPWKGRLPTALCKKWVGHTSRRAWGREQEHKLGIPTIAKERLSCGCGTFVFPLWVPAIHHTLPYFPIQVQDHNLSPCWIAFTLYL